MELKLFKQRLEEAENAYHALLTGTREVTVNISGYGSVTYSQASIEQLKTYCCQLKEDLQRRQGLGSRKAIFVEF